MAFTPRLALNVDTYFYTPNVWIKYRKRPGSILAVPSLKKINDMTAGVEGVLDLWMDKHPEMNSSAKYIFTSYCVKVYFFALIELKKLNLYNPENIKFYRNLLLTNVRCTRRQLIWILLMKGDIGKLIKFLIY